MSPRFDVATDGDEPEIRRILRENPMPGAIRLSLEREPDSRIAARIEGPILHQTIVGRRPGGGLFGFGTRGVRTMYLNGTPQPVGYLGGLRLDADHRGNAAALRQGYLLFGELHDRDRATPLYLTSILSDNANARRLLEANLRGMPTYRFVGEFVTVVLNVRRTGIPACLSAVAKRFLHVRRTVSPTTTRQAGMPVLRIEESAATAPERFQFASPPLPVDDTRVACDADGRVVGRVALWDQRSFKQAVVRGYTPAIARSRRLLNVGLALAGRPTLPAVGALLPMAYVSSLVAEANDVAVTLVREIRTLAAARSLDHLCVGLAAGDPVLPAVRRAFGGREIRSRLYVVHWPDGAAAADALDGRLPRPEVALL